MLRPDDDDDDDGNNGGDKYDVMTMKMVIVVLTMTMFVCFSRQSIMQVVFAYWFLHRGTRLLK